MTHELNLAFHSTRAKTRDRDRISSQMQYKTGMSMIVGAFGQSSGRIAVEIPVDYGGKKDPFDQGR